jgi:hypothetical protein
MNFLKLDKTYNLSSTYKTFKSIASYGKNRNETFVGINYSMVATPDAELLFSVIPKESRKDFYIALMEVNTFIPPHVDTGVLSTINFYIKSDGCTTQFYDFKPSADKSRVDTKGYVYDIKDLCEADSFVADDGDAYLLDTTKVHAVWDMAEEVRPVQMSLVYKFEDASATDEFDVSKKDFSEQPIIKDKYGRVLDIPSAYRDTYRVALCLQSRVHGFDAVKEMLGS